MEREIAEKSEINSRCGRIFAEPNSPDGFLHSYHCTWGNISVLPSQALVHNVPQQVCGNTIKYFTLGFLLLTVSTIIIWNSYTKKRDLEKWCNALCIEDAERKWVFELI